MLKAKYSSKPTFPDSYIYKMKPNDSLILHRETNNIYYVIQGILIIHKCFSNKEMFTINIIGTNGMIAPSFSSSSTNNYFYIVEALSVSYVINNTKKNMQHNSNYIYRPSRIFYYGMEEILIHKTVKNRLIHILLKLSAMCGVKYGNKILLEVQLSYQTLSCITGTSKSTIRKLIRYLIQKQLIEYRKQYIIINNLVVLSTFY